MLSDQSCQFTLDLPSIPHLSLHLKYLSNFSKFNFTKLVTKDQMVNPFHTNVTYYIS